MLPERTVRSSSDLESSGRTRGVLGLNRTYILTVSRGVFVDLYATISYLAFEEFS